MPTAALWRGLTAAPQSSRRFSLLRAYTVRVLLKPEHSTCRSCLKRHEVLKPSIYSTRRSQCVAVALDMLVSVFPHIDLTMFYGSHCLRMCPAPKPPALYIYHVKDDQVWLLEGISSASIPSIIELHHLYFKNRRSNNQFLPRHQDGDPSTVPPSAS